MSKNLIENLNSNFLEAFSAMKGNNQPKKVLVYVESDEDISFWRNILDKYRSNNIEFEINLPAKEHYEKGKGVLLNNFKNNIGDFLIICLDSDYDYLIKDLNEHSKLINSNPYIFQTYSYSIENLLCYGESLKKLCITCTKVDTVNFDIEGLIVRYSKIIYELLIWSIYLHKNGEADKFSISSFCKTSKLLTNNDLDNNFEKDFVFLEQNILEKITEIETLYSSNIEEKKDFEKELNKLGLNESNSYLYAQGHLILDNFILMIIKPICYHLKSSKIQKIKENCKDSNQITNELNNYKKKILDIEQLISVNYNFSDSELYKKIIKDLDEYTLKLSKLSKYTNQN